MSDNRIDIDGLPPLVILEGCDMTGKTTFAEKLIQRGYRLKHFKQPKGEDEFYRLASFLAGLGKKKYVVDRFHMSEMVYGPLYRGRSLLNAEDYKRLESYIRSFDHLLILFEAPVEFIDDKFGEEDYAKKKDIPKILRGFRHLYNKSSLNKASHIIS